MTPTAHPLPASKQVRRALATLGGRACPVCDSDVRSSIDIGDFQLFVCDQCRSWCSDALVRGAATSFLPKHYFGNDEADRPKWETLLRRLDHMQQPLRSVLDIGCGTGAFLAFLDHERSEARQTGIELDPERARHAQAASPRARIHVGDALEALGQVDENFDLITLWDVFEHLPAPQRVLQVLASKLSEQGCIFIQTIHKGSVVPFLGRLSYRLTGGRLRYLARRTHDAHHLVFFSCQGLSTLAHKANLQIRDLWFDRLAFARMDGSPLLTAATSLLLSLENAIGNGLFVNLILDTQTPRTELAS